jgi:hypothetical protein
MKFVQIDEDNYVDLEKVFSTAISYSTKKGTEGSPDTIEYRIKFISENLVIGSDRKHHYAATSRPYHSRAEAQKELNRIMCLYAAAKTLPDSKTSSF